MNADDWIELDELARSIIMLTLHNSVYVNVKDTNGAYGVWSVLSNLYEKKSAASQVYWLKKLIDLRMKESTPMSNHLNDFSTIVSQLQSQEVAFDGSVRAMFLLVTLPTSWDTFHTTVSNSAAPDSLKCADVESSLLMKEMNHKNVDDSKSSNAMHVRSRSRSRGNFERRNKSKSRCRSKSRPGKGVECYYCHKKGHMKKDCYKFKRDKKKDNDDKRKGKNASDDREAAIGARRLLTVRRLTETLCWPSKRALVTPTRLCKHGRHPPGAAAGMASPAILLAASPALSSAPPALLRSGLASWEPPFPASR
ncbi:hypothetical protein L7F22_034706 [Adiantum nelumboides]|nr:hypothetical protein [Adiantum nelumboides]